MKYNADQQEAIECSSNLVVLAPPGSGKSGMLVGKTEHTLLDKGARISLVTFTDKAVHELKERLAARLPKEKLQRTNVQTFHKHCMLQLRQAGQLGKLLSPFEAMDITRRAMQRTGVSDLEAAAAEIEAAKSRLDFTGKESDLVSEYEEMRRSRRASDLHDVVRETVIGMKNGTVPLLQATHLLADEYQDTDPLQQEWVLLHVAAGIITSVVGDDDQSIYAFRKALGYQGMLDFERRAEAHRVVLKINYRSNAEILHVSGAVIRKNVNRVDKEMLSAKGAGGQVEILGANNHDDECDQLIDRITESITPNELGRYIAPPKSWAVIARTNMSFRVLIGRLREANIAYTSKVKLPDEVRVLCDFLSALQNGSPGGVEALLIRRRVSEPAIRVLSAQLDGELHRFLDGEALEEGQVEPADHEVLSTLARLCSNWRRTTRAGQYQAVVEAVSDYFLNGENDLVRGSYSQEIVASYTRMLSRLNGSLLKRVEFIMREQPTADESGVQLLTMHASKGLEYDNVAVIQCNEGVIPSAKSEMVEEERRLFFVAMTRAREHLAMIYQRGAKSPFIVEAEAGLQTLG